MTSDQRSTGGTEPRVTDEPSAGVSTGTLRREHIDTPGNSPASLPPARTPAQWVRSLRDGSPLQRLLSLASVVFVVLAFACVVIAYGVLPGRLPDPVDIFSGSGISACVARDFPSNLVSCPDVAFPTGYRAAFGQPELWVAGFLQWLGMDLVNSVRSVWLLTLALAFWGSRRLFDRVTDIGWLAWIGVLSFMLAPIVSTQGGYGALQLGFVLVPTYLLMDVRFAEALSACLGTRVVVVRALVLVVVRTIGLMMDPYSFVIASVTVGAIWMVWAIRGLRNRRVKMAAVGAATVLASFLIAYFLYSRSVDTSAFTKDGLDYFRGAGVDLYALVVPSNLVGWASLTGLHHNIGPLAAYSDGHNLNDVYLGVLLLALAVTGLFVGRGRRTDVKLVAALSGAATFLLALGPSVRIDDFRVVNPGQGVTYTMPASAAAFASPWSWLYEHVPGISSMRAVWRWELGVRLAVVVLAVLALSWWVNRTRSWRTRWIPALLGVLLVVESIGNVPFWLDHEKSYLGTVRGVEADVTNSLATAVKPGERAVLYGPGGVSPGSNDYMANMLCSTTDLRCYNVGGDKALAAAAPGMPPLAQQVLLNHSALGDEGVEQRLRAMFTADQLDVVVLVNFDLAAQATVWPPAEMVRNKAVEAGRQMFNGGGFSRVDTPYYSVIRRTP